MRSLSGVAIELVFGITAVKLLEDQGQDKDDDDDDEDGDDGYSNLDHGGCGGQDGNLRLDWRIDVNTVKKIKKYHFYDILFLIYLWRK